MFKYTAKNLGHIREGHKVLAEFPYDNIHSFTRFIANCGCNEVHDNRINSTIIVEYTPRSVPPDRVSYVVAKTVQVYYQETPNSPEVGQELMLEATIIR